MLGSGLVMIAALLVSGLALSWAFRQHGEATSRLQLEALIDAMLGASEIGPDGVLRFTKSLSDQRFTEPYSGLYWQVSEQGLPDFRSRSLWDTALAVFWDKPHFQLAFLEEKGPAGQNLLVATRDVTLPEATRVFRYMVALDRAQLDSAIRRFNGLLFLALGLVGLTIAATGFIQVRIGLRPLRRIGRDLARVRKGTATRMEGSYPLDLQPLAEEIDALIIHNDQLLTRSRTHVGNLAHGLKTPLAVIRNELVRLTHKMEGQSFDDLREEQGENRRQKFEAEQSAELEKMEDLLQQLDEMSAQIDHHLRRARLSGAKRSEPIVIHDRLVKIATSIERLYAQKGIVIRFEQAAPDTPYLFVGELQDFDEMFGNLIDNAAKWAKKSIRITIKQIAAPIAQPDDLSAGASARQSAQGQKETAEKRALLQGKDAETADWVAIIVEDDGGGVDPKAYPLLLERGMRLDEEKPGSGLELAITRDAAALYGGDIRLGASRLGGLSVLVRLPVKS